MTACDVETHESAGARNEKGLTVDPRRCGDRLVKTPFQGLIAPSRQQLMPENIEPEQLFALRMPKRPLAETAKTGIVKLRFHATSLGFVWVGNKLIVVGSSSNGISRRTVRRRSSCPA